MGGWQRYSVSNGDDLRVIDAKAIPIQAYLGPVGMPGVTGWYGLNRIIAPKLDETVLVSAATGAVGSVVGQLAKLAGARAVGIAGGTAKCAYAVRELGYDTCVDHKSLRFAEDLKDALPNGVDGLFETIFPQDFAVGIRGTITRPLIGGSPLARCQPTEPRFDIGEPPSNRRQRFWIPITRQRGL